MSMKTDRYYLEMVGFSVSNVLIMLITYSVFGIWVAALCSLVFGCFQYSWMRKMFNKIIRKYKI